MLQGRYLITVAVVIGLFIGATPSEATHISLISVRAHIETDDGKFAKQFDPEGIVGGVEFIFDGQGGQREYGADFSDMADLFFFYSTTSTAFPTMGNTTWFFDQFKWGIGGKIIDAKIAAVAQLTPSGDPQGEIKGFTDSTLTIFLPEVQKVSEDVDWQFAITPMAVSAAPEPATLLLVGLGLGLALARRRS